MAQKLIIGDDYSPSNDVTLYNGDRINLLDQIKMAGSKAELIVTSPPYNIGKVYEEQVSLEDYVNDQKKTIDSCVETLSETGSICWQVGHFIEGSGKNKEAYPLDIILYPIFKSNGLILRNRIVWHFGHGLHEKYRFSGRHETILWFTRKSEDYTFNLDPIRILEKYPGKRAYSGPKAGEPSGNPLGKNPSDVWEIPNVKANHVEKTEHPCQFPIALVEILIKSMTNPGDLVVDPYMGVGSTAIACLMNNRKSAGSDTEKKYIDISRDRLFLVESGKLKIRPMHKPVHRPNPKSKVAQVPFEWGNDSED